MSRQHQIKRNRARQAEVETVDLSALDNEELGSLVKQVALDQFDYGMTRGRMLTILEERAE